MKRRKWYLPLRNLLVAVARRIGTPVRDAETGELLGRAVMIPWRGKIVCIGLDTPVCPVFLPQERLTYWKQELGFRRQPPPDYPSLHDR